jgi:uncharacterized membrane protein YesL
MADFNNNDRDNSQKKLSLDEIEELEQEEKKKERSEKFNIFSRFNKDGKGVEKDEIPICDEPTLKNYFVFLGRKLNQLLSVNIIMILGNFPVFFLLLAMSGYLSIHLTSPAFVTFAPLYGAIMFEKSPGAAALWAVFSRQSSVTIMTTADKILLGIGALVIITFGLVRIGVTYIIRNMFRGEPVFMMHDFFYAIRRNLKQGIIYGILDVIICGMLIYDIVFFNLNYNISTMTNVMFFMSLCLAVLYFFMRHYIYLMLVTFDLSLLKMFKNALLFTVLGVKRNIMVLLGTLALAFIEYLLLCVYFPLGVIFPFIILPSLLIVTGIYGVYPKIKEIMIDPYYEKVNKVSEEE